jgi:hypothetical protein
MAIGLAVSPASAAPPSGGQTTVAAYSCGTFEGLSLTQSTVSYTGVSLRAGETITARMAPAATGDKIILSVARGFSITMYSALATQGLAFKAPADGTYNLGRSLEAAGTRPSSITWTFDCSSTSGTTTPIVADADRDGVADSADACAGTILPDAVSKPVAGRYFANRAGQFVDGANRSAGVTVVDAGGCSAVQIAKALRLSVKDSRSGITLTQLHSWASTH